MKFRETINLISGKVILLGNEAIARGAIEAGVGVAAGYPGTPSTEILEALASVARDLNIYVEWSVNEKTAFEVAYGAALSGVRALVTMKHVGLNVAADPLMSSAYTGVEEGFVIVSADDPSMWSSQNEQDNRIYGIHAYIPVLEPSTPKEAKELCKEAFELSSRFKHPVILRTTTRISHTRGVIELGPIPRPKTKGVFKKNPERFVLVPANARKRRLELIKKWLEIESYLSRDFKYNRIEGEGDILIIAPGIAYAYVREVLQRFNIHAKVLKLASPVPLPSELVTKALDNVSRILVVEELEPIVEQQLRALVQSKGLDIEVHGKDYIGLAYEITFERVIDALSKFLSKELKVPKGIDDININIPPRPPVLCPGCPYRPLFYIMRKEANKMKNEKGYEPIFTGDIGCYSLGLNPPYRVQDTCIAMGASIGLANGLAQTTEVPIVAIIGDSTFFHAGIPPLLNAVYNEAPFLTIVLDNRTTAMTGHQPHPGTGFRADGRPAKRILVENVARGLGIEYIEIIDPFNLKEAEEKYVKALNYVMKKKKPALIVSRRSCALLAISKARRAGFEIPRYVVNDGKCKACGICYKVFACPAITSRENGKAWIDPALCTGCGVCMDVCPFNAITLVKEFNREKWSEFWR